MRTYIRAKAVSVSLLLGSLAGCTAAGGSTTVEPTRGPSGSGGSAGDVSAGGSTTPPFSTGAGTGGASSSGTIGAPGSGSIGAPGPGSTGAPGSGSIGAHGSGGAGQPGDIQSGLLTAGVWDDNINFDFYLKYLKRIEDQQIAGLPLIPRANRLEIRVVNGEGAPVGGASVVVAGPAGTLLDGVTRPDGQLFFLPGWAGATPGENLEITATRGNASATMTAKVGDSSVALRLTGVVATPAPGLDLALVIDTTGSMGDEISYLKVELDSIAARVAQDFPGITQRWALVVYRDEGDDYVVSHWDFTDSLSTFRSRLGAQSAGGGGDYPEAPDRALAEAAKLSWRSNAVAQMAFWVADAPHHAGHQQALTGALAAIQQRGVRIYPVASSGVDELTEYTMRTAAQVTGGRYLFLTDDSGIGGAHKEPTIPCYLVTTLSKAMLRMISMELSGRDVEPAAADVIRTGGNPKDGRCILANGDQVSVL